MELLFNPKEFLQKKKPVVLIPYLLLFIVVTGANAYLVPQENHKVVLVTSIIVSLISLWLAVTIGAWITKLFVSAVEGKKIEDKKYFKQVYYLRALLVETLGLILNTIFGLITEGNTLMMLRSLNGLLTSILGAYLLYNILTHYVKTEKLQKILPFISVVFSLIATIGIFFIKL